MTQEIVRALVDGVWVTEVASQGGSGGSQTVRWVLLDEATAADAAENGPVTLYTPTEGEYVMPIGIATAAELVDQNGELLVGVLADLLDTLSPSLPSVDQNNTKSNLIVSGVPSPARSFNPGDNETLPVATDPIVALYVVFGTTPVTAALAAWQANHAYGSQALILDSNGNIQQTNGAGTSGPTEPVWDTDTGDTTEDGDIPFGGWTNLGPLPAAGSVTAAIEVVTPAAES